MRSVIDHEGRYLEHQMPRVMISVRRNVLRLLPHEARYPETYLPRPGLGLETK